MPFTETQPPESSMPPANVDVDVFDTIRLVTVVVPSDAVPERVTPFSVALFIVPPLMVGVFITVFVN